MNIQNDRRKEDNGWRELFQKLILDNTDAMNKVNNKLSAWDEIIGKDENSGMRKWMVDYQCKIYGINGKPGVLEVLRRLVWAIGAIFSIGGIVIIVFTTTHTVELSAIHKTSHWRLK